MMRCKKSYQMFVICSHMWESATKTKFNEHPDYFCIYMYVHKLLDVCALLSTSHTYFHNALMLIREDTVDGACLQYTGVLHSG